MSFTMTRTASESFTITHAKILASKVTADMRRCQQNYGKPSDSEINDYGTELALLLRDGYVDAYEFGFSRDDARILSWRYSVDASGQITTNDRPGGVIAGVNISGAWFFNQLTRSTAWEKLTSATQESVTAGLPIRRVTKSGPRDGAGKWVYDLNYSSGGVTLGRKAFQPL
jgi:hypothetical protein